MRARLYIGVVILGVGVVVIGFLLFRGSNPTYSPTTTYPTTSDTSTYPTTSAPDLRETPAPGVSGVPIPPGRLGPGSPTE